MKLLFILLLSIVALSGNTKEANFPSHIIQPQEMTQYIGETSTFVIKANFKDIDKIVFTQDNNTTTIEKVTQEKNVYCKSIELHVGANNVVIDMYKEGTLVNSEKRNLYFLSELFEGFDDDEAEEYELRYFHTDKKEDECKACHDMTSNIPTDGEAFEDVSKTTCFNCHQQVISTSNTHAPATNWLCLDCHNGKFGEYNMDDEGASKYLAPDPIAKTCGSCHDTVEEWNMNKYTHGPVNDGRCERCHNPHGSKNEFFLRKNIWDICTTCHAEKANGKHVIPAIGFGRPTKDGGHPTKDRMDPARPGREFTCSSCHNPHGSGGIFLLRMKGSMPFGVCQRCHKK